MTETVRRETIRSLLARDKQRYNKSETLAKHATKVLGGSTLIPSFSDPCKRLAKQETPPPPPPQTPLLRFLSDPRSPYRLQPRSKACWDAAGPLVFPSRPTQHVGISYFSFPSAPPIQAPLGKNVLVAAR